MKKSRKVHMSRLVLTVPEELEKRFRDAVYKRYGMKKGNISKAVREALELWISVNDKLQKDGR
jgi:metal-responsive CopG/Arc/MetJ family transcriptional regulator